MPEDTPNQTNEPKTSPQQDVGSSAGGIPSRKPLRQVRIEHLEKEQLDASVRQEVTSHRLTLLGIVNQSLAMSLVMFTVAGFIADAYRDDPYPAAKAAIYLTIAAVGLLVPSWIITAYLEKRLGTVSREKLDIGLQLSELHRRSGAQLDGGVKHTAQRVDPMASKPNERVDDRSRVLTRAAKQSRVSKDEHQIRGKQCEAIGFIAAGLALLAWLAGAIAFGANYTTEESHAAFVGQLEAQGANIEFSDLPKKYDWQILVAPGSFSGFMVALMTAMFSMAKYHDKRAHAAESEAVGYECQLYGATPAEAPEDPAPPDALAPPSKPDET